MIKDADACSKLNEPWWMEGDIAAIYRACKMRSKRIIGHMVW